MGAQFCHYHSSSSRVNIFISMVIRGRELDSITRHGDKLPYLATTTAAVSVIVTAAAAARTRVAFCSPNLVDFNDLLTLLCEATNPLAC